MLVLSRAVGELISIGDDISVRVLSVSGGTVRFGVEAPRHVDVHRSEIYDKILSSPEIGLHLFQSQNARCTASGVLYFRDR